MKSNWAARTFCWLVLLRQHIRSLQQYMFQNSPEQEMHPARHATNG